MSGLKVRNLDYIRSAKPNDPSLPNRIFEALSDLKGFHQNTAQQTNANPTGEPQPPAALDGFKVSADENGYHHVQFIDNGQIYRGVRYYAFHADNPQMRNALPTQASGTELRNHMEKLGPVTRYWAGYHAYPWSGPSPVLYHGGAQPIAVTGGSGNGGPAFQPSQGTGTGAPGVLHSGPGPVPFRSSTGAPPVRKS